MPQIHQLFSFRASRSILVCHPYVQTPGERMLTAIMASHPGSALLASTLGCVDVLDVARQAQVSSRMIRQPSTRCVALC